MIRQRLGLLVVFAARLARRRVYRRWAKPATFDRNLIVIGAGAAGLVSAYIGAAVKAKVTLIEQHKMGGDCLNYGCVPSKALIRSAKFMHQVKQARSFGIAHGSAHLNFADVMARVRRVITCVAPHDSIERYRSLGVDVRQGHARITSPWSVSINGCTLTTRAIVIATGARPLVPPLPGLQEVGYLTSDTVWSLTTLPRRLLVLGGGPIGCELAQCFARLGAEVTLVEMAPHLLGREDADAAGIIEGALKQDGVRVCCGHAALRAALVGGEKHLVVSHAGVETVLPFDTLLLALGRSPRTEGYGLEELGIPLAPHKTIEVNPYLQTLYPNIYACGDVAGPYQFTHTAAHQAWYASVNALFGGVKRFKVDYSVIPWTTFTDPEVARVGLSETEAKARAIPYEVTRYDLADLDRAITDEVAHGFVKVLTMPGRDRILGVTIVGEHAGDLLAEFVLAMKYKIGLNKILGTIHTYPTLAEANKYAAGAWKQAHAPQALLALAQRYHAWRRGA
jgi:pyruvate/2-oxoglutarate dehydrogenase complex dihydrolipoamide dehydrogenase (E3) component